MDFSSVSFDKLLKIVFLSASWVKYNENTLLMMYYHTRKFENFINIH